jgi:hypothetical protein
MSNEETANAEQSGAAEPSADESVQAIYNYAAGLMQENKSHNQIVDRLVEQGLERDTAHTIVSELEDARSEGLREAGKKNMLYGALWCIGGIVVTAVTYSAASGPGGGRYYITWGAVVFGAIQFFQGLSQVSK